MSAASTSKPARQRGYRYVLSSKKRFLSTTCIVDALNVISTQGVLSRRALTTDFALWEFLTSADEPVREALIKDLGLTKHEFLAVLTDNTVGLWKTYDSCPLKRHSADALLVCAVALGLALLCVLGFNILSSPCEPLIISAHDLLPFRSLVASDLALNGCENDQGARAKIKSLVGTYPLHEIEKGKEIRKQSLSAKPLPPNMGPYTVFRVFVPTSGAAKPWTPPFRANVFVSPRNAPAASNATMVVEAYVLHAKDTGTSTVLWIGVPIDQASSFAALLGSSSVYLAAPGSP